MYCSYKCVVYDKVSNNATVIFTIIPKGSQDSKPEELAEFDSVELPFLCLCPAAAPAPNPAPTPAPVLPLLPLEPDLPLPLEPDPPLLPPPKLPNFFIKPCIPSVCFPY